MDGIKEQKMKKMLLLLASLACFGMLVSCSDDPQDVYVTNNGEYYEAVGVMTGTATASETDTGTTYAIDNTRYASVSASSYPDAAKVTYTLTVPYTYTYNNTTRKNTTEVTVTKIAGKYYTSSTPVIDNNLEVDGSLEGSFTVKTSVRASGYNSTITISNLKFEKK